LSNNNLIIIIFDIQEIFCGTETAWPDYPAVLKSKSCLFIAFSMHLRNKLQTKLKVKTNILHGWFMVLFSCISLGPSGTSLIMACVVVLLPSIKQMTHHMKYRVSGVAYQFHKAWSTTNYTVCSISRHVKLATYIEVVSCIWRQYREVLGTGK
jgi:hypothetical protein